MASAIVRLGDQQIALSFPDFLRDEMKCAFGVHLEPASGCLPKNIRVTAIRDDSFAVADSHGNASEALRADVMGYVMEAVMTGLIEDVSNSVVLHAGAVALREHAVVIAGPTGAGKSSLVAWLINRGFQYLTDEIVVAHKDLSISPFSRALVIKPGSYAPVRELPHFASAASIPAGNTFLVRPDGHRPVGTLRCALFLFVRFTAGSAFEVKQISRARVASSLVEANLNARNLEDGGFPFLTDLARRIPGIFVTYGHFEQLAAGLDPLLRRSLASEHDVETYRSVFPK